ncbi:MAG TPA: TM0106 family RecB-like putative nuclease, partial [Thermoanaerobaculia bacterium]
MRVLETDLILSTSDITKFVRCDHATFIDRGTKNGTIDAIRRKPSGMSALISTKGDAHEHAFVDQLRATGKSVVAIAPAPWSVAASQRGEAQTLAAMRSGAEYIYQAAFFDGRWSGYADLLQRVERPSNLGAYSYEVIDTKLARSMKAHFLLQLSDYSHHVARLQGVLPESMHVELGSGTRASFRVADYAAYYRYVRASLARAVGRTEASTPFPVEFCSLCDWFAHCSQHWRDVDHLSLVANIRRTQVTRLERGDVKTLTALAEASPMLRIRKIAPETFGALQHQAKLQLGHRQTGKHTYELLPLEDDRGFARLPRPSANDVFFDVEGDPFIGDGLTFLFGVAFGEDEYRAWWAHDADSERKAFEEVMAFLVARRRNDGDAHVYHYGAMEVSTLKRLAGRYGTCENELDDLLRREAFVDLSSVVKQGMRISHSSYGLKKVETFYFTREHHEVAEFGGAVLAYEQWLEKNDPAVLDAIEQYNREDCISTLRLRRWLVDEVRPADATWREPQEPRETSADRIEEDQQNDALFQALQNDEPLLAQLLYYHRREERPAWWAYHARKDLDVQELIDDSECIGALTLAED